MRAGIPDRLRHTFGLVEAWVTAGVLPGAAVLVARGGPAAGEAYFEFADHARGRPVDSETL